MVSKNNNQIYRARQNDQKRGQHTYKSEYMKMNRYFQEIKIYFERWVRLFKETGTFNIKLKNITESIERKIFQYLQRLGHHKCHGERCRKCHGLWRSWWSALRGQSPTLAWWQQALLLSLPLCSCSSPWSTPCLDASEAARPSSSDLSDPPSHTHHHFHSSLSSLSYTLLVVSQFRG